MNSLGFLLLAAGFLLAVVPAQAQSSTTLDLEGWAQGGAFYFTKAGETARNPTLVVPANTEITVTLVNKGGAEATTHNFCYNENSKCSDYVNNDGESVTYKFTSGTANGIYYCLPHKSTGMQAALNIEGADPGNGGGEKKSPGVEVVGVSIALVGAALLLRSRRQ